MERWTSADRASLTAELLDVFGKSVDIVVLGYTHEVMTETHHGVLFVNPGSPTMIGNRMKTGHVATMELNGDDIDVQIIPLADLNPRAKATPEKPPTPPEAA
jgi:predicted phosphodiesterase